ncbi:MAG: esterase family protein [Pirellulaceae bacterium]|nr:esterase family protein [Pirellulaceae bacterium]
MLQFLRAFRSPSVTVGLALFLVVLGPSVRAQTSDSSVGAEPAEEQTDATQRSDPPAGKIDGPYSLASKIFPGTQRDYWIYVPAAYAADKPACTMVVQDGMAQASQWNLPAVLDELIHAGEVPVTVGIFVSPGVVASSKPETQPRFNRSFEYDSLGDRYARFLLEELLPEVAARYNLSSDPNHRAIAGASSGAICAFNAAWERPDAFRRVLSTIGTYVGLRGGHEFPVLVRKTEQKPLRIFLQGGSRDLNIYAGDWWLANQSMLSALQWAGYDVHHSWGDGGHDSKHAKQIMPDALRWLWRDFPQPIAVAPNAAQPLLTDIMIPGSTWQQVSTSHESIDTVTCNAVGVVYFSDSRAGRIYRLSEDQKTRVFKEFSGRISSMRFGPDENLYCAKDNKQVLRLDVTGAETVVIPDHPCHRLVTLPEGFYFSEETNNKLFWSTYAGQVREAVNLVDRPAAMIPTADQAFMHVALPKEPWTLHFQIADDFSLQHRQRYGYLHVPYLESSSGVTALATDDQGRLYVASSLGIQVLDQLGRVHLILSKPSTLPITGLVIGGPLRDMLYAADGQSVYARKLKIKGVDTFSPPIALPKPRL